MKLIVKDKEEFTKEYLDERTIFRGRLIQYIKDSVGEETNDYAITVDKFVNITVNSPNQELKVCVEDFIACNYEDFIKYIVCSVDSIFFPNALLSVDYNETK